MNKPQLDQQSAIRQLSKAMNLEGLSLKERQVLEAALATVGSKPMVIIYTDSHGKTTRRAVEVYGARVTADQNVTLTVWESAKAAWRSFRVDRVEGVA